MGMIRYCFGGIEPLVCELLRRNLALFIAAQSELGKALGADAGIEAILHALLAPLQTPALYTPGIRAAAVTQDIFAHSSDTVKEEANSRMHLSFAPLLDRLAAACPQLSRDTVLWRFCCVCIGGLSLSPRAPAWQLFQSLASYDPMMGDQELAELIATAAGALCYPPAAQIALR